MASNKRSCPPRSRMPALVKGLVMYSYSRESGSTEENTMARFDLKSLSRREREVLYLVYELGKATALDIQERLEPAATYNATRRLLETLTKKGAVQFSRNGRQYVYEPVRSRFDQGTAALAEVLNAFFDGSPALGFMNLMKAKDERLQDLEIENLKKLLDEARNEGR